MKKAEFYSAEIEHRTNGNKLALIKKTGFTDGTYNYYESNGNWFALDKDTGVAVAAPCRDRAKLQRLVNSKEQKEVIAKAKANFKKQNTYKAIMDLKKKQSSSEGAKEKDKKTKLEKKKPVKPVKSAKTEKPVKSAKKPAKPVKPTKPVKAKKPRPNPFKDVDDVYVTKNKIAVTKTKSEKAKRGYKKTVQTKYYKQSEGNIKALKAAKGSTVRIGRTGTRYKSI